MRYAGAKYHLTARGNRLWSRNGVFAAYVLIVLVLSWPLPLSFGTAVLGHPWLAVKIHLWQFWWTRHALLDPQLHLFHTPYLYAPDGLNTLTEMGNFLWPVLSVPFQMLFGLAGGYNAVFLFAFALGGTATYALCRHFRASRLASFVGGAAFVCLPYAWMKVFDAEFEIAVLFWLPVGLLQLDRCCKQPSVGRAMGLGGILFLGTMSSWYYGFFLGVSVAMAAFLFFVVRVYRRQWKTTGTLHVMLVLGGALLLHGALVGPFARELNQAQRVRDFDWIEESQEWDQAAKANTGLLELFAPWQSAPTDDEMRECLAYGISYPFAVFPGVVPLVLAACGLLKWRRIPLWVWGPVLFFWILALGPWLQFVGSEKLHSGMIPLPAYFLATHFRAFAAITIHSYRAYALLLTVLCVLAAFGFDALVARTRLAGGPRRLAAAGVVLLITATALSGAGLSWPLHKTSTVIPEVYTVLAEQAEPGFVMNIPVTEIDHVVGDYMLAQTGHQRPILSGRSYETRFPGDWGDLLDGLYFREPEPSSRTEALDPVARFASFRRRGVRFLAVHWQWLSESRRRAIREMLNQACTVLATDPRANITIYRIKDDLVGEDASSAKE